MRRRAHWLLAAGILLLGCGSETSKDETIAQGSTPEAAHLQVTTDKALVQVVIHGLATFKIERDTDGKLTALSAHLPKVSSPRHDLLLQQGVVDGGKMKWANVTSDDAGRPLFVGGKTITIHMMGGLGENRSASIGDYPASSTEAADVGWMLGALEIDTPTSFDSTKASAHVLFQNGILETCALVFPPKAWGTNDQVCKIKVENDRNVERSASEIMVIRGWVPKADGAVKIDFDDGTQVQTVTIPATGGKAVTWQGTTYDTAIDVGIANRYFNPGRDMETDHANHLKDMFPGASRSWDMSSPDCTSQTNCSCKPDLQPECWTEYFVEIFKNSTGGYDRPICPFVGWTQ